MNKGFFGICSLLALALACGQPATTPSGGGAAEPAAPADAPTTGTAAGGAARTVRIGMVAKSESNEVFQAAKTGAFDAAKELSTDAVKVEIDWRTPSNEDAIKQAEAIAALANEGVDAILVSATEARTLEGPINDAVAKGIVVGCFDSDIPGSNRMFFYGTNDEEYGGQLMAKLAETMGGTGTIAILGGNESAPNLQGRIRGVRAELAKHAGLKELNNGAGVFYHAETPEKAAEAIANAMNANPGLIQGWVLVGGWPLFTEDALRFEPGSVKVIAGDALPKQLAYVKSGHVQALLPQDCYGWGTQGVKIALDKVLKNTLPDPPLVYSKMDWVTQGNVDEFAKFWDGWLKQ